MDVTTSEQPYLIFSFLSQEGLDDWETHFKQPVNLQHVHESQPLPVVVLDQPHEFSHELQESGVEIFPWNALSVVENCYVATPHSDYDWFKLDMKYTYFSISSVARSIMKIPNLTTSSRLKLPGR